MKRRTALILLSAFLGTALFAELPFNFTIKPDNLGGAVYRETVSRFELLSSDPAFTVVDTGHQSLLRRYRARGRQAVVVTTGLTRKESLPKSDAAVYLADTRFLSMDSPEIRSAADKLRGSPDPIDAVERFVHGHIADKALGIPLVPAAEVFRIRRGDCTEHSVLATAILRSLGVPARAVVGVYLAGVFNGRKDVFVYHMWVEAYAGGRWRLTDATRPGGGGTNRYIAFAHHNLKTEAPLSYLKAVSSVQDLRIRYCGGGQCQTTGDQPAPFCILAQESRRDTALLNTGLPSVESGSTEK